MAVDSKELEDFMPNTELEWSDTAVARMKNVPFFVLNNPYQSGKPGFDQPENAMSGDWKRLGFVRCMQS